MDEKSQVNGTEAQYGPPTRSLERIKDVLSDTLHVRILDRNRDNCHQPWKSFTCESSADFARQLPQPKDVSLRIISFYSSATCLPIKATLKDFEMLFRTYDIDASFADTLATFGRFPDPTSGLNSAPTYLRSKDGSHEWWYRLQYPERKVSATSKSWSIRHTGVYYRYCRKSDFRLVLLIHPCHNSALQEVLFNEKSEIADESRSRLSSDPTTIHQIVWDTYLDNWSSCIREQSQVQGDINDDIQTSDLKSGSLQNDFQLTQRLRFLKNTSATHRIQCQDNLAILDELKNAFANGSNQNAWLVSHHAKAVAQCKSLALIQDRIQNDIELLEHMASQRDSQISHENQGTAAALNETLLNLTYNTVDDSATIKIITIFTLIFLPGSFVASIFGMNFFNFEEAQSQQSSQGSNGAGSADNPRWNGLNVGSNFWIFIATWLPVTAVVLLIYLGVTWRRQRIVQRRRTMLAKGTGAV